MPLTLTGSLNALLSKHPQPTERTSAKCTIETLRSAVLRISQPLLLFHTILKDKTMKKALITGANKSIGFETARQLLNQGYFVYLGSRDAERGEQAVAQLKSEGLDNVELLQIDVSDPASIEAAGKKVAELDVLINNAGILGGMEQSALTIGLDTVREVYDTNFFGAINVTQTFIEA